MSKAPAFQFYANDFMDATSTWEANAVGLYVRCLCKQWTHGGIPSDLKILARAIHCDRSELESVWDVVGPKFIAGEDGLLRNSKLERVRARQEQVSSERSKAGKAGAIAKANAKANASTKEKQRKVKEKEKVEVEEEVKEGVQGEPRKGPHAGVQGVIDHLTTRLREEGIAQSLDGAADRNRFAAKNLLNKLAKDYPDHDPLVSAKALIEAALKDPFHRKNSTSVAYLYNNCGKIAASTKDPKNKSDEQRNREFAAEALKRFGQPAS